MTFKECVAAIIEMDGEAKAIQILSQTLVSKENRVREELMEHQAAIRAIRKVNAGSNKAIDALCDMEFKDGE